MTTRKDLDEIIWIVLQNIIDNNRIIKWTKSLKSLPKDYSRVTGQKF